MYQLASPRSFYHLSGKCLPWLWATFIILFSYGLINALLIAPPDYQQGDAYRIIYIHVPCAFLSLGIFIAIAIWSGIFLIWRIKVADILAKVSAPIGAWFTACVLITGMLWGKPMWGTYWIWDARLTSELVLLFIYFGVIALRQALPEREKAAKACGIFSIIGAVDIPIIHYSVYWWNTLHQKDTLRLFAKSSIVPSMLHPLLIMIVAFMLFYFAVLLLQARAEILMRERRAEWVGKLA